MRLKRKDRARVAAVTYALVGEFAVGDRVRIVIGKDPHPMPGRVPECIGMGGTISEIVPIDSRVHKREGEWEKYFDDWKIYKLKGKKFEHFNYGKQHLKICPGDDE